MAGNLNTFVCSGPGPHEGAPGPEQPAEAGNRAAPLPAEGESVNFERSIIITMTIMMMIIIKKCLIFSADKGNKSIRENIVFAEMFL